MEITDTGNIDRETLRDERRSAWEVESGLRGKILKEIAILNPDPVVVSKRELNYLNQEPEIKYGADDDIEIQLRYTEENGAEIWVRNATIARVAPRPLPTGTLEPVSPDDLENLVQASRRESPYVASKVARYARDLRDERERGRSYLRAYAFKEGERIIGWAYVGELGSGMAHLTWIQTFEGQEGRGVGSAIIHALKERYRSIELSAVSKHPTKEPQEAQERLMAFYKNNGFVGGEEWQRPPNYISLDDLEAAREWQRVGIVVGVDNAKITDADIAKLVLKRYQRDTELRSKLPEELARKLDQWTILEERSFRLEQELMRLSS